MEKDDAYYAQLLDDIRMRPEWLEAYAAIMPQEFMELLIFGKDNITYNKD